MDSAPAEVLVAGHRPAGRRRRVVFVGAVVALLALVAVALVPVGRAQRDRSALRRVQTVWAERAATHSALSDAVIAVTRRAGPEDGATARQAVAALEREDAARLGELRRQAASTPTSGALRRLRDDVTAALAGEQRTLVAAAAAGSEVDPVVLEVTPLAQRVESELPVLQRRMHVAASTVPSVRLHAGDAALRRFAQLTDTPLPVRLLVNAPDGRAVFDLARNRVTPRPEIPDVTTGLVRGGYLVAVVPPDMVAFPLVGGAAKRFGRVADGPFAGPQAGGFWMSDGGHATLVDVSGVVRQRVALPGTLRGAVGEELVVGDQRLEVWDPTRRVVVRRLPRCNRVLGTAGDRVALASCRGHAAAGVHVVDVRTGRDHALPLPSGFPLVLTGDLAPDGRHLALVALSQTGPRLVIVDPATGATTVVRTPGTWDIGAEPVWTPDSTTVFFSAGTSFEPPAASLWSYRLGSAAPRPIRYVARGPVLPLAALPAG